MTSAHFQISRFPALDLGHDDSASHYTSSWPSPSLSVSGVRQALWLTKSQLICGLPTQLLSPAEDPANQIPDQDERVQNAIKHARFWDTTETRPSKEKYR